MPLAAARLLLVTSDPAAFVAVGELGPSGPRVLRVYTAADALRELSELPLDLALVDLELTDIPPRDLVATIADRWPDVPVVLLASAAQLANAEVLVQSGAQDYVRKPVDPRELAFALDKAARQLDAASDDPPLSRALGALSLIGRSRAMLEVLALVERAAHGKASVLVRGETGSGKEVVARRIHELSSRSQRPFLKVHCAALPEQLLESELFGYEKGAFTGAQSRKPGRVELAEGGTLFLDEIGDISPATQVKLLRILQDRKYERLGGSQTLDADVRFVTATHRNLEELVSRGQFREDLYYRINVISITAPPLREHPEDIPELALHFALLSSRQNGRSAPKLDGEALRLLSACRWPGNVRQLQNVIERLVVMTDSPTIGADDVRPEVERIDASAPPGAPIDPAQNLEPSAVLLNDAVRKAERRVLEKALGRAGGNRAIAARLLGISRRSLYYKLVEYGLGG